MTEENLTFSYWDLTLRTFIMVCHNKNLEFATDEAKSGQIDDLAQVMT